MASEALCPGAVELTHTGYYKGMQLCSAIIGYDVQCVHVQKRHCMLRRGLRRTLTLLALITSCGSSKLGVNSCNDKP